MQLMSFLCRFQFQTSSSVLVWDRGKDIQGLQLSVITGGAVFQLEHKTMNSTAVVMCVFVRWFCLYIEAHFCICAPPPPLSDPPESTARNP